MSSVTNRQPANQVGMTTNSDLTVTTNDVQRFRRQKFTVKRISHPENDKRKRIILILDKRV